jgi:hypothetical protein
MARIRLVTRNEPNIPAKVEKKKITFEEFEEEARDFFELARSATPRTRKGWFQAMREFANMKWSEA